jgi:hypothetical protein
MDEDDSETCIFYLTYVCFRLHEPDPLKPPIPLKRPKTRVVPKIDLYPENAISRKTPIPKNTYIRKSPNPKTGLKQVPPKKA